MDSKEQYEHIKKLRNKMFDNLRSELLKEKNGWRCGVIENNLSSGILEFNVSGKRFLLQLDISLKGAGSITSKCYLRRYHLDYFPDSIKFVNTPLPQLDFKLNASGEATFDQLVRGSAKVGFPGDTDFQNFDVNDFGFRILEQIDRYIYGV
jgi:hypothetical protein